MRTKLGLFALLLALTGAGISKLHANDELWRPDKQTGIQISPEDCVPNPTLVCALLYHEGEDMPYAEVNGEYIPN